MLELNCCHNIDALSGLKQLASESAHCGVTSPPYYGLRDYGAAGQIRLEPTPEEYISRMIEVFREFRRVLRDDGTLWINIGDSYAGSRKGGAAYPENAGNYKQGTNRGMIGQSATTHVGWGNCKPKDLIGIPWMLAFALRADGWYLRQDIIWYKPNPMPESVRDRCTKSHEYIFLFSKSPHYYFDQESILEPVSPSTHMRISQNLAEQIGSFRANGGAKTNGPMKAVSRKTKQGEIGIVKNNASWDTSCCLPVERRNKRSVWTVTTQPFKEAHFATFPPELIKPCIQAGCPEGGTVVDMFMGSGTTLVTANELNRNCIGFDVNLVYCDMANRRRADAMAQQSLFRKLV